MEEKFEKSEIRAIVGLGNPGKEYSKNRHNIGFRIVDELAERLFASWSKNDSMEHASAKFSLDPYDENSKIVHLIKPMTFMNNSGRVINFLAKKGIKSGNIVVAHDELEKSFGKINLKFSGSAKGHNGLRSIINFASKDFWRLQFGIGRPDNKEMVGNYVLSNFSKVEEEEIFGLINVAVKALLG
jgi:peptidyl-tRNA hydrolase, PTH1 family